MRTSSTLILAFVAAIIVMPGCVAHRTPVGPTAKLSAEERNFRAIWQASKDVLTGYNFGLDREDRRAGIIVTKPLTGKHLGELWRRDAATAQDLAESTVQTVYRQAKITIRQQGNSKGNFRAFVEVQAYLSNKPQRPVSSVSDAYDLFKLPGAPNQKEHMLAHATMDQLGQATPLGRDKGLEEQIAAEILAMSPSIRQDPS